MDQGALDLDRSGVFFSAGEHGGDCASDNDSAEEGDDHNIDWVEHTAEAANDKNPDATFQTRDDGAEQEPKEVEQQVVDLSRDALVEKLKHQWNHDTEMSMARRHVYIEMNRVIDFIHCHRSAEATCEELGP